MDDVATLTDPGLAELLMHPTRRSILEAAAQAPVSATGVARDLGEPRQKVNYHLRALADAGLLEAAGERPRRGLVEKLYRASARAYTVSPEVLGTLTPSVDALHDAYSAQTLVALADRMHAEVARSAAQAASRNQRLATLSIDTELRFSSARQKAEFAEALMQAVADVVSRFSDPAATGRGQHYRLVAGAYPVPLAETPTSSPSTQKSPSRSPTEPRSPA